MRLFPGTIKVFFIGLLFWSNFLLCQEIPEISKDELAGFSLERNDCFNGGSLWGYMNGGADIYLEYGFDILRVEEFTSGDENIKLEIFKMDDPYAAFGIYSIKTFKCEKSEVLVSPDCLNRFQYQLLYGDYYIQFINESGSARAKQVMVELADTLLKKLNKTDVTLPVEYFVDSLDLSLQDITMLCGELGIQDKAYSLAGYFKGITDYQIYFTNIAIDGRKQTYYNVIFDKPEMKTKLRDSIKGMSFQILEEGDHSILFRVLKK